MRELLFRGKTVQGSWVQGWLGHLHAHNPHTKEIDSVYFTEITDSFTCRTNIIVDYGTIGQYVGLKDTYGTKIFEGDIVAVRGDEDYYRVGFDECCFQVYGNGLCYNMDNFYDHDLEVVGNIYDNPELVEEV